MLFLQQYIRNKNRNNIEQQQIWHNKIIYFMKASNITGYLKSLFGNDLCKPSLMPPQVVCRYVWLGGKLGDTQCQNPY